jgi:hypothetical protein
MVMMPNPVAFCIHMRHSSKSRAMDCHTQWNQWNMTMQKSNYKQVNHGKSSAKKKDPLDFPLLCLPRDRNGLT